MHSRIRCPYVGPGQRPLCPRIACCKSFVRRAPTEPRTTHDNAAPAPGVGARVRALLVSTLSSCAILLSSSLPAPAADALTIKFPASPNPEIRGAQEVLVQAWGYVRELFVDPTFNSQDWTKKLQDSLTATFRAASGEEALQQVTLMLDSLGDPFTRVLLPGGASEAFQAMKQAKSFSTGLLVGRRGGPQGPLVVSSVIAGSPSQAAGLREGDELVAINGRPVWALRSDSDSAIQDLLRQDVEVSLKVLRRQQGPAGAAASRGPVTTVTRRSPPSVSGVEPAAPAAVAVATAAGDSNTDTVPAAAPAEPMSTPSTSYQLPDTFFDVVLRPAPVEFVPVQYAVVTKQRRSSPFASGRGSDVGGGGSASGGGQSARGPLVTVLAAPAAALTSAPPLPLLPPPPPPPPSASKAEGVGSWLLDVRSNPGGIVGEGLRVAELLMRPGEVFAWVRERDGAEHAETLSDRAQALVEGQPIALLVDHYSASTSELLAGALHDDAHALLIGERTYGKGRTQQVIQLSGGATLLVSTDMYVTPARRVVDRVGLAPDVSCRPGPPPPPVPRPVGTAGAAAAAAAAIPGSSVMPSSPVPAEAAAVAHSSSSSSSSSFDVAGVGSDEGQLGGLTGLDGSSNGSSNGSSSSNGSRMVREQVEWLLRDTCVQTAIGKLATRGSQTSQK
ncbi:hypothetical protein VOLCADRAFT_121467 [Volvox carteri f. nagariensis]|uniref:PDZ domain-containing protein n=1 Tax=Volvox carteri f. nagariensis TaxID=3068 RepID=D8UAY4_VOLCA|nr:uncharacterized protein VOLCADRAFT_121467 [Volvox carteri f. nagariensis]EFJ43016.1 hypothetical protein VOLCADRAFT_121467 [Volvox carteri f. nagariensis]|eukprot:XP_002955815.1 hypothetical protein VOLCADRAFT_121467 [Volvox carteri f. nagariensis]